MKLLATAAVITAFAACGRERRLEIVAEVWEPLPPVERASVELTAAEDIAPPPDAIVLAPEAEVAIESEPGAPARTEPPARAHRRVNARREPWTSRTTPRPDAARRHADAARPIVPERADTTAARPPGGRPRVIDGLLTPLGGESPP